MRDRGLFAAGASETTLRRCRRPIPRRIAARFKLSWYHALFVASAIEGECDVLFSEYLQNAQRQNEHSSIRRDLPWFRAMEELR
jgi:hypothetical protein